MVEMILIAVWTLFCLLIGFHLGSSLFNRPLARAIDLAQTPEEVFQAVERSQPSASAPDSAPQPGPSPESSFQTDAGEEFVMLHSEDPNWRQGLDNL